MVLPLVVVLHPLRAASLALLLLPNPVITPAPFTAVLATRAPAVQAGAAQVGEQARLIGGLYERGHHDMVIREASEFLKSNTRHADAELITYHLAASLFELDRLAEARPHFQALAGRSNFRFAAEANMRLGQCLLEAGEYGAAVAAFQRTLTFGTDYLVVPATYMLGDAEFRNGAYDAATGRYEDVLRRDPEGPYATDARSALAWCAFRTEDFELSARRAAAVLQAGPSPELANEMRFLQGEILMEQGRPGEARSAYRSVRGGSFADAALRGTGLALAAGADHAAAASAFGQLVRDFPESRFVPEATLRLGIHRLQAGDADGAWRALRSDELPDDAETAYWRARTKAGQGDDRAALELLSQAASRRPGEELARHIHRARGDLLASMGRSAEAAKAYHSAGSDDAWHAAAVTRLNEGDAAEALSLVQPLIEQDDADPAVQLTYAEALFTLERYDEAETAFKRVAARSDDGTLQARALSRLGWCRRLQGDNARAAQYFSRVVDDHLAAPEAPEALFMQGVCLDGLGRGSEAVTPWSTYLQRHPDGEHRPDILMRLAELGTESGQGSEARNHLRTLLADGGAASMAPRAQFQLAESQAADGLDTQAVDSYSTFLERFPDHEFAPAARYGMAWGLSNTGDHQGAVRALGPLTAGTRKRETDAELVASAHELLLWCHRELKQPQDAERAWNALAAATNDAARLEATARSVAAAWKDAGQAQRAARFLDQALEHPALAHAPGATVATAVESAWLAIDEGRLDDASQRLTRLLEIANDDGDVAEACFFLGEAYFAEADDDRAIPFYAACSAAKDSPLPADALYKEGFARLRKGDPLGAERCFERLLQRVPDSELAGESIFLGGEAAWRRDDFARCAAWNERLLDEHPRHQVVPKARFRLGLSLARLERWEDAERALSELARRHPDFENLLEAELWRGHALVALSQERGARAAYERIVSSDRGVLAARAQLSLGKLELARGDMQNALSDFLRVAVLYAHDEEVSEALLLSGRCLEELGDTARAHDRYRELIDKHPDSPFATQARARLKAR